MAETKDKPASHLLLDELFEAGDPRFLDEVLGCTTDAVLKALATKWYRDTRPWARKALLAYVDDGCDRPRHRVIVKRLLNLAEESEDDELMAHFVRAFDTLVQHDAKTITRWDYYARDTRTFRRLVRVRPQPARWTHWRREKKGNHHFAAPHFAMATRRYLRRRAFRWFRMIGWKDPARFMSGVITALGLYRDEDLARPEHLLDAYGLANLLYYGSDVVSHDPHRIRLNPGRTLAELTPAPVHPDAWRGQVEPLVRLLFRSDCVLVRRFLVQWLEREEAEALRGMDARKLRPLLLSPSGDVRAFAVRRLEHATGLGTLPITDWLELLEIDDPELITLVCRLVTQHVDPKRLDRAQCVKLACARPLPVAELGFGWLKDKPVEDAAALLEIMKLADAQAEPVRVAAARWLLERVTGPLGTPEHLRELIDARHADVRSEALAVMQRDDRFRDATPLWLALSESPYPDVSDVLMKHLAAREKALPPGRIEHVWATTLLSVHRGSRAKRVALRQIAERVVRAPDRADALLPLLRVALRSVREAERRVALAAICQAAFRNDTLRASITREVPELRLFAGASA